MRRSRNRLDSREKMPSGMEEYLSAYGWHFNKKLFEFAVSQMLKKDKDGNIKKIGVTPKEDIMEEFKSHNITIENCVGYDVPFVYHMMISDFYGETLKDTETLLKHVKLYIDDVDGYDGLPMTRFYADCIGSGTPIM